MDLQEQPLPIPFDYWKCRVARYMASKLTHAQPEHRGYIPSARALRLEAALAAALQRTSVEGDAAMVEMPCVVFVCCVRSTCRAAQTEPYLVLSLQLSSYAVSKQPGQGSVGPSHLAHVMQCSQRDRNTIDRHSKARD